MPSTSLLSDINKHYENPAADVARLLAVVSWSKDYN